MKQARSIILRPTNGYYMHVPVLSDLGKRHFKVLFDNMLRLRSSANPIAPLKAETAETVQERWRKKGWRVHDYMVHPMLPGSRAKVMRHVNDTKASRMVVIHPMGYVKEYSNMEATGWYSPAAQEAERVAVNKRLPIGERRTPAPLTAESKAALLKSFSATARERHAKGK